MKQKRRAEVLLEWVRHVSLKYVILFNIACSLEARIST